MPYKLFFPHMLECKNLLLTMKKLAAIKLQWLYYQTTLLLSKHQVGVEYITKCLIVCNIFRTEIYRMEIHNIPYKLFISAHVGILKLATINERISNYQTATALLSHRIITDLT